ncbi:hypothetical protein BDW74DRAFT_178562 [Aspergillus multicolor]|uniref:uncharacterized protein n=1 Tax=Aspergillus multicolor TaxID=41759 RepID=UPI003CCD4740
MVMNWNAESDARLFLGVLNQLRDAKLKLDNQKLAEFMGPDCLPGAIVNRIVRLRRMAEAETGPGSAEGDGSANNDRAADATGDSETTPQVSLQKEKRKVGRKPRGAAAAAAAASTANGAEATADTEAGAGTDGSPKASQKRKAIRNPRGSVAPKSKKIKSEDTGEGGLEAMAEAEAAAELGPEVEVAVKREEDQEMDGLGDDEVA